MTIFQKMLIVPLVSIVIYASFIMYADSRYRQTSDAVVEIRDDYIPMLDIAAENNSIFKEISQVFKDSVLAGEASWIHNSEELKSKINYNFYQLEKHPHIVDVVSIRQARDYFNQYYNDAKSFALSIISGDDDTVANNSLSPNIQQYYNQTKDSFFKLRKGIFLQFKHSIDSTNQDMKQLVFWGGIVSLVLILVLTTVTIIISLSTRKNLLLLNRRMKSLATGGADFSKRLKPTSRDELGTLIYWFNQLSIKLEGEHKQLEIISNTDKLTQLNNRMSTDNFIMKALTDSANENKPLSVVIVDIDFFKSINDKYGHQVGDDVLIVFADILRNNFRDSDFIGRWGGEEFIIALVDTRLEKAQKLIEGLRLKIESHGFDKVGQMTASFGLTQAASSDDIDCLFKRMDDNLYQAKESGRNKVISSSRN